MQLDGRLVRHAPPRSSFEVTNAYGIELSSHKTGIWAKTSDGEISAAITTNLVQKRVRLALVRRFSLHQNNSPFGSLANSLDNVLDATFDMLFLGS